MVMLIYTINFIYVHKICLYKQLCTGFILSIRLFVPLTRKSFGSLHLLLSANIFCGKKEKTDAYGMHKKQ